MTQRGQPTTCAGCWLRAPRPREPHPTNVTLGPPPKAESLDFPGRVLLSRLIFGSANMTIHLSPSAGRPQGPWRMRDLSDSAAASEFNNRCPSAPVPAETDAGPGRAPHEPGFKFESFESHPTSLRSFLVAPQAARFLLVGCAQNRTSSHRTFPIQALNGYTHFRMGCVAHTTA